MGQDSLGGFEAFDEPRAFGEGQERAAGLRGREKNCQRVVIESTVRKEQGSSPSFRA